MQLMIPSRKKNEDKKSTIEYETHENIDEKVDENELSEIDKLSLDEKKWRKPELEYELKIKYDIKITNIINHIHNK